MPTCAACHIEADMLIDFLCIDCLRTHAPDVAARFDAPLLDAEETQEVPTMPPARKIGSLAPPQIHRAWRHEPLVRIPNDETPDSSTN